MIEWWPQVLPQALKLQGHASLIVVQRMGSTAIANQACAGYLAICSDCEIASRENAHLRGVLNYWAFGTLAFSGEEILRDIDLCIEVINGQLNGQTAAADKDSSISKK